MPDDSAENPRSAHALPALLAAALIIVAVVIVIPNLLRSRIAPGESSSVGSLRTINTAEVAYATTYLKVGFSPSLAALGPGGTDCSQPSEQHACLIDGVLASGLKSGYRYRYEPLKSGALIEAYSVHADPAPQPPTLLERLFRTRPAASARHFFSDQSGVVRSEMGREAGPGSPPL